MGTPAVEVDGVHEGGIYPMENADRYAKQQ